MLTREEKSTTIEQFWRHEKDTGSPEVQVSLLTRRINRLAEHFKEHRKDSNSRRGLLIMVNQRRRLLDYLKKKDPAKYATVISHLGLRR